MFDISIDNSTKQDGPGFFLVRFLFLPSQPIVKKWINIRFSWDYFYLNLHFTKNYEKNKEDI